MRANVDAAVVHRENRRFHDEVEAEIYDQRMGIDHGAAATRRMIEELEDVLGEPLPRSGTVVDVGAGTGHVAVKLARTNHSARVIAVDMSPRMLEQAALSAGANGCRLEVVQNDMAPLPFSDASVDLVVGCAVLHHLPDPVSFMAEVRRILKPGSPCIFIGEPTPSGDRLIAVLKWPLLAAGRVYKRIVGRPAPRRQEHIDVHTFSVDDIGKLTSAFDRVRIRPQGFLEPILDSGYLTLVRELFAWLPGVMTIASALRRSCRNLDARVLNHLLPRRCFLSMKFSALRPPE